MAERRVTLTKYDPSSDCANTWASELFTVAKLGRLVRRIQNNVKGYGEFSLRTLDERREESKTPENNGHSLMPMPVLSWTPPLLQMNMVRPLSKHASPNLSGILQLDATDLTSFQ